jgi:hypothetical protein
MYKTIEALYKNGRIYPVGEKLNTKQARVLLTIIDEPENKTRGRRARKITSADLHKFAHSITLREDPLAFQQKLRNEWQ